jgi:putative redox protein
MLPEGAFTTIRMNPATDEENSAMPKTLVKWVEGKQFVGMDSRNHSVVLSGDDPARGVSPSQTLLIALSACSAYDVVDIMTKKRKPLSRLEVTADGEQDPQPPWAYRRIHLKYRLAGKDLSEKAVAQAIQLSQEKYCSVAATLRGVATITFEFEIVSDASAF